MTTQTSHTTATQALPAVTEAAVLHAARDLRIEHKPLAALGPNDVLVGMRSGGICGSDMHYYAEGRNGTNELRQPTVLGHEGAGVVIATGADAAITAGTAVVIEPALPCGSCPTCGSGRYNVCATGTCFGSPPTDGLFARHVVVPAAALHALPVSIPAEVGAAIEPLAVAVWAVERAQVQAGHRVLITGAGPIGLLVAQVAAVRGAAEIIVTDVNDAAIDEALRSLVEEDWEGDRSDAPIDHELEQYANLALEADLDPRHARRVTLEFNLQPLRLRRPLYAVLVENRAFAEVAETFGLATAELESHLRTMLVRMLPPGGTEADLDGALDALMGGGA